MREKNSIRIAILDECGARSCRLGRLGAKVERFYDTIGGRALIDRLKPFVCLMRERTPLPAEVIAALPNLRLIVTTGRRNAAIDVAEAARRGITVCGTESRAPATAQMAMKLILAASRGLLREGITMRDGGWQAGLGRRSARATLGLEVVRLARPFGMSFLAWSANLSDAHCAEVLSSARRASVRHLWPPTS